MLGNTTRCRAVRSATICGGVLACLLVSTWFRSARAGETARPERGSRSVEEIIQREGSTKPDWYDSVPLDYPKTLDLSWPQPKGKWNPQVNVGQYLISVVYRRPDTWRSTAKLFHHIIDISDGNPTARRNAMDRLAHVYSRLLGDFPRAAYWWQRYAKETGDLNNQQAVGLAECYWRLGGKEKAEQILRRLDRGTVKLWAEMGELDEALAAAKEEAKGRWPYEAILAAGNACRSHGRYRDAMVYYKRLATLPADGNGAKNAQRMATLGQQSVRATQVYQDLDLRSARDGEYTGAGDGYRGPVQVKVTVRGGAIQEVKVTQHKEDWYCRSLTDIPRQLTEKQGVRGVHAVTGATYTSNAIVNGAAEALRQASR